MEFKSRTEIEAMSLEELREYVKETIHLLPLNEQIAIVKSCGSMGGNEQ